MSQYKYVAVDATGKRIEGERKAGSRDEVLNFLYSKDLTIVSVNEKIGVSLSNLISRDIGGLPLKEKVLITRELATMIAAGIPIIQAIDILVQQADKEGLKAQLTSVYKSIESGSSLSEAFRKEKGIFAEIHINLLAAGEKSGNLNEILDKIAYDLETSKNLRGKITGAMIYPAIIFVVLAGVFVLMITTLLPQIKDLYKTLSPDGKGELPPITEFLLQVGAALSNVVVIIFLVIVTIAVIATYKYLGTTPNGKKKIDAFKLKIPVFGTILQKYEVVQFCRLTAMLLNSGVQIIETLQIVAKASGNQVFRDIINNAIEDIIKGTGLAAALAKYNKKEFPVILLKIMATGEESGKLDQILTDMGKYYESELDQLTSNLTKSLEPLIMLVAAGLVGFLAIAVYLPIFQVGNVVGAPN